MTLPLLTPYRHRCCMPKRRDNARSRRVIKFTVHLPRKYVPGQYRWDPDMHGVPCGWDFNPRGDHSRLRSQSCCIKHKDIR